MIILAPKFRLLLVCVDRHTPVVALSHVVLLKQGRVNHVAHLVIIQIHITRPVGFLIVCLAH